ncbi:MAG: hypothetical protein IJ593_10015 [Lachnospiraceae bacterium]|nr:hypothetical protein [Lachnospiraceae bacterium]
MENEVSGIAKLGIVLIALAVLIGLGFGIFQISKGTANTGVNNVQAELDGVAVSQYSTYDQTVVTGTIARSALTQYEGKETAILVATQAWVNAIYDAKIEHGAINTAMGKALTEKGSGFDKYGITAADGTKIPVVFAFNSKDYTVGGNDGAAGTDEYEMKTTATKGANGCFINYNAILGSNAIDTTGIKDKSGKAQSYTVGDTYYTANIYFDKNCFRCETGFLTSANGRVQYNNTVGNIQKTGTTEFIPTGAKFQSYLVKDPSGTVMGIALQQINNV